MTTRLNRHATLLGRSGVSPAALKHPHHRETRPDPSDASLQVGAIRGALDLGQDVLRAVSKALVTLWICRVQR
jgi:hypothetical protein